MEHGTAVHMCSISNSFDCLKFLLESEYGKGYNLNEFDEKGKLPLTLACERLCSENVVTLLEVSCSHSDLLWNNHNLHETLQLSNVPPNIYIYMSHFAYACKMRYPLNLVLENSEYLWFYSTFCIVILDYGLKLHKLSNHILGMLQK